MADFRIKRGGIQDRFLQSKAKIQIFGGGFGNGKTTAAVVKSLNLANDYPGMNALMARSTFPKLNDTLRKEFIKWCPKDAIDSFPMSVNASNTCTLTNGTMINFRYVSQQGKKEESTTSNLLSATFDLIVVDQMEDPEITYKDFLDLLGRLRGQTLYRGEDETMPRTGPRWMILTINPTRNWVYKKLIAPIHLYQRTGQVTPDLLCVRDMETNAPVLDDLGKPILLVELFEGGTLENAHNLPDDFYTSLSSVYQGQMKDRFLKGEWASYEGLIYPQFNELVHCVDQSSIKLYLQSLIDEGYDVEWLDGYDHGLAAPSCYLLSFIDPNGNVIVVDGFYEKEYAITDQFDKILEIRAKWKADPKWILADPDIFRRKGGKGLRISDMFWNDAGLRVMAADNTINSGITKVSGYLNPRQVNTNPFTKDKPAPSIYFSSHLTFIGEEMGSYFWRKDRRDEREDTPSESPDHSLDVIKYLLTNRPAASELKPQAIKKVPAWMSWHEQDVMTQRSRRHG